MTWFLVGLGGLVALVILAALVGATLPRAHVASVAEPHLCRRGAGYHVVVRDEMPLIVPDESGAGAARMLNTFRVHTSIT